MNNRRGFLGGLFAVLGMGQRATKCPEGVTGGTGTMYGKCFDEAYCKEGEERCPLGHCQKPQWIQRIVWITELSHKGYDVETDLYAANGMGMEILTDERYVKSRERVCSICGIVYVPPAKGSER